MILIDWEQLTGAATAVREFAYRPYSGYAVGAALIDDRGRLFTGCNVENVSYGATICAERGAICKMISEGGKSILSIAISTSDGGLPCGICLQVMQEFRPTNADTQVGIFSPGQLKIYPLSDLLPIAFASFRN